MSHVLLDTHVWAWSLTARQNLSGSAEAALHAAETVSISAITLYEIGQKVRVGKWPEMAQRVPIMVDMAHRQGLRILDITPAISLAASLRQWDHRDPFDRIIGATAWTMGLQLISADDAFDDLAIAADWPGRVW